MSSPYPVLGSRPIDQWKVTELKEELKRRKLMTKGLKEDLIKRLDEAIRSEQERSDLNKDNGYDSVLPSEMLTEHETAEAYVSESVQNNIGIGNTMTHEINEDMQSQVTYEQERSNTSDSVNHGVPVNEKVSGNMLNVDINEGQGSIEEKLREEEGVDGSCSVGLEGTQTDQVTDKETSDFVAQKLEPVITLGEEDLQKTVTHSESHGLQALENDDSKPLHVDAKDDVYDTNNQVSEVKPVLGFEVKSDSISTETVSIIENNELKDNIIADDVKLEVDVKPEMVQPSSSSVVPEGGKSHPMDVEEPHANKVSLKETGSSNVENADVVPKNETGDLGFSEKPNVARSYGDYMEEDVRESKRINSKVDLDEIKIEAGKVDRPTSKDEGLVDIVSEDAPAEKKVAIVEDKGGPAAPSGKRKLNDQQTVGNNDIAKRQRRWNSEGLKIPEPQNTDVVSTTPKDVFQPAFRRSFSRSDSTVGEEVPKERVVPPSPKPPTNSIRIDRFLRPFTLKAVQELLGKTGTVTNFWMDQIKTHCYVSYSSVEEAVETRNAVYNLQWPPNGGRLLVAEFVDPQEVKVRVEAPPQSPATPVSSGAVVPPVPQSVQPQPSPRPQLLKQQLPQPPLPPPPPLLNPPPSREHPASVKERLTLPPPPPPLPEKIDPPILTLDDLFRKTKATPRIYYLALSDDQVAAKLQAQGKTGKQ